MWEMWEMWDYRGIAIFDLWFAIGPKLFESVHGQLLVVSCPSFAVEIKITLFSFLRGLLCFALY